MLVRFNACMKDEGQTWKLTRKWKKSQIKLRLSWYRTKVGSGCYWMPSYKTVWEQSRINRRAVANQSNTPPLHKLPHAHEQRKCTHQPIETHITMCIYIDSIHTLSTCIYKSAHVHTYTSYKGTRMNSNTCTYKYTTQLLGFWQGYPTKQWTKILLYPWETSYHRLNSHPRWTVDLKEKSGATTLAEDTTEHLHEPRVANIYTSIQKTAGASYKENTCLLGGLYWN